MNTITEKVSFGCQSCGGHNLKSGGAVKTDDDKIYVVFTCEDCGEAVPINVDSMITELYIKPVMLAPGSKLIN